MKIGQLRVNHESCPMGFLMDRPTFSWVVEESTGKRQSWARVTVALDEAFTQVLHDSGEAELSSLAYEAELPLTPRTRYYWSVTVQADDGDTAQARSWFETGKREEAWQGKWIALPGDKEIHPILRRRLTVNKPVAQARLYICGLGLYEAYINGRSVTDEHFAPYYDAYNKLIQYQTWDVTRLMQEGENELSAMLGMGWYMGRFGFGKEMGELYGSRMQLLAELHIRYEDGTQDVIVTDDTWQGKPSPVTFSGIYDGEGWDARLENSADWQQTEIVDAPAGELTERISPPVRIVEELPVAELLHTPAGELVLDFGQVLTGWVTFRCDLPEGEKVFLQFGELLQHDCFYNENLRTARQEYLYHSAGKAAQVRPHFTFYGFRFVKVEGMTEEQIRAAGFTAQVIHSDLPFIGALQTGHAKVNRLIANARWGQRGNFLDIPTDCPQRDERMGWTGDAQVFCATASYNMYTPSFYRKFLINMLAEQQSHDGSVPHVIPDMINARNRREGILDHDNHGSCAWADAAAVIPWTVYRFYGDKGLLREMYPSMKAWADWVHWQDAEQCGDRGLWTCGFHFADWLALDNPDKDSCFGGTDNAYIASAYYYYSTLLTAKAAGELGYAGDAALYAARAEKTREAFRREFFTPTGRCAVPTQTAHALALAFDLAPEEHRERLLKELKEKLERRRVHLDTGFVGTPLLCPVLSANGLHDMAVTLLLQEDYPSWLYEVNMGATTVWERWNSVMPDGLVSDTGMNSMNHYAYGSVVEWMYRTLAGISPAEDVHGFKKAVIAPQPDERLGKLECTYASAGGCYRVAWEKTEDGWLYSLTIPFDASASVQLPGMEAMTLNAGSYEFAVRQ